MRGGGWHAPACPLHLSPPAVPPQGTALQESCELRAHRAHLFSSITSCPPLANTKLFQLTFPWMCWLSSALACAWGQCLVLGNLRGRAASSAGAGLVLLPVQGLTFSSSVPGGNAAGGASFSGKKDPARYCAG